jgi:YD repeat-containing protein
VVVTVNGVTGNSYTFTVSPGINGIAPAQGNVGTSVTISGTNFGTTQGSVTFNGVPASLSSWSNTSIKVTVPSSATTGNVAVVVNGESTTGPVFTLLPVINSLSPTAGPVGTVVTVSGSNFGSTQGISSVAFGQFFAVPTQWSQDKIVVPVPLGAVTSSVVVTVSGLPSNAPPFTVGAAANGSITGVVTNAGNGSPLSGASVQALQSNVPIGSATSAANGTYTISNLAPGNYDLLCSAAGFGTSVIPGNSVAPGGITTVNVPLGSPGTIAGTVTQSNGVTPIVGANVTVIEGNDSVASATTSVSGAYSVSNLGVATYGLQVSSSGYMTGNQAGVSVSAGQTTTANFSLTGQSTITYTYDELGRLVGVADSIKGSAGYSYDAVGNIKSIARSGASQVSVLDFTPKSGPVGTAVTVSGTSFNGNAQQDAVSFTGASATATSATSNQLAVTVPTGATTGPITVTTPNGTATSSASFTVTTTAGGPTITSFAPTMGNPGGTPSVPPTTVTITGTGFDVLANDRVEFNGALAAVTSATSTSISATVPASAQSGPISIATPAGSSVSNADFFVVSNAYAPIQVDFTEQMSMGGSYTGTIVNGGDIGIVLFSATAGQQINLLVNGSSIASATVSILGPGGSSLEQAMIGVGGTVLDSISAPTSGLYTILVASNGATFTGSLTLNLSQSSSQTNSPGSTTTGQVVVNTPGQSAQMEFNGTAGQLVSVQLSNSTFPGTCYSVIVSILAPGGSSLGSTDFCGQGTLFMNPIPLPTTGTYTLVIAPYNGGTGSATVALSLFSEQTMPITPVAAGTTGTLVTISTPGQDAQLTFSGTAGQSASVQLSNSTFPGTCYSVIVSILAPGGSSLGSTDFCGQGTLFMNPIPLPTTGTYTLVIAPYNGGTGSASVALSMFSEQTGMITSGTPSIVIVNTPGQDSQLSFNGSAGQLASVLLTNSTFPGSCYSVIVSIFAPGGSSLGSTNFCGQGSLFANPVTLPTTGTYTLVIAPYNGGTGSTNVTLYLFSEQTGAITPNSSVPVSFITNTPGQDDQLTFSGNQGQQVTAQITNSTFSVGCYALIVSILNPDGSTLGSNGTCFTGSLTLGPITLTQTGTHTLVVAPQSGSTGSASVSLTLQ